MSILLWISLIVISSILTESLSYDSENLQADDLQYRLPNDTRPETYDVYISTNIHEGNFLFEGTVSIGILVESETSSISLHHYQLNIREISLVSENGIIQIPLGQVIYNIDSEILTIPLLSGMLQRGERYTLNIVFSGTLQERPRGFYRSSYIDDNGIVRFVATTQFAMTDARHGFPCYDEPSFRANFTIKIRHGSIYNAISNMPVNGIPLIGEDGMKTTTFLTTPNSPTYILAYTVSDFEFKSNEDSSSGFIPFRTYARYNAIEGATYSVEVGEKLLAKYNEYFGINFPLPKMDQVAVADFPFRAMENWGMVVYKEPYLLLFPNSTDATETDITTIMAHEFAHQWFGNLVTPKWWTYAWLSEGFSTLFEYLATNWVFPEWKINDVFVYKTLQDVFKYDAQDITRPMSFYADSPDDILGLLDNIAYAKSGCVLRMIMHAITEETFKRGLINYFTAKAYSAADENDLFEGLAQSLQNDPSSNQLNITAIMSSWTQQKGFPFLIITRNHFTGSITVRQERYQSYVPTETDSSLWWIPYNFASASSSDFSKTYADGWLSNSDRSVTISQSGNFQWTSDEWIIFNKQQTGYYRVLYDEENYKLIANELVEGNFSKIHLTSRSELIDDAFDFAETGRLNYSVVFDIIAYLKDETEYVPWASAFRGLEFVHRMMLASENYHHLQSFTLSLVEPLFNYVGIKELADDEPRFQKQLRILTTNWACRLGSEDCLESTRAEFRQNLINIPSNMRAAIYCNGLRKSPDEDFPSLKDLLATTVDLNERNLIITALGCSSNENQLINYILTSIDGSYLTESENYLVFTSVLANEKLGVNVAVQFLENNLQQAARAYGATNINNAIIATASNIISDDDGDKFIANIQMESANSFITDETIVNVQDTIRENKDWIVNHQKSIENWLENFDKSEGNSALTITLSLFTIMACYSLHMFL